MIRATQVRAQHRWTEAPADTVVLDFDDRHRRRMAMRGTRGLEFLLDLENATVLRGGDAVVLVLTGEPIDEPIVGHGPFVMNTEGEIRQAIVDFNSGRFGAIAHA